MNQHASLILSLYEIAQHTGQVECKEEMIKEIKRTLSFDAALIGDLGIFGDRLIPIGAYLHNVPAERLAERQSMLGEEIISSDGRVTTRDPALRASFGRRGNSVATDIARSTQDRAVLAYCRKFETAHSLTFVSDRKVSGRVTAISFWRASRRARFSDDAVALADLMLPHLIQARQVNERLTAHSAQAPATSVISDLSGKVYFAHYDAISLLQEEWPQWSPPLLPDELVAALRSDRTQSYLGRRLAIRARVEGSVLNLSVARRVSAASTLTPAELRSATLAARGLQYKEIAKQLGLSPSTVRNQLSSAYRKLDVANKTSLSRALMEAGILPHPCA
ncbi:LuxR C-terminal-related transcriptional regulator [Massilia sp. LjRoot122]